MASLGQMLQQSAMQWSAKNIAAQQAKEEKKEGTWGGIMSLLKPVAGFATKGLLTAAGIGSGGLLTPLLMGLGTSGISKIFDVIGRKGLDMGADPSEIEATSKYGFGKETAKTIREGLEESIDERDPFSKESVMADVVGSYVSALTPKISFKDGIPTAEGGDLGKTIKGLGDKKSPWLDIQKTGFLGTDVGGLEGVKLAFSPEKYDKLVKAGTVRSVVEDEGWDFTDPLEGETSEFLTSGQDISGLQSNMGRVGEEVSLLDRLKGNIEKVDIPEKKRSALGLKQSAKSWVESLLQPPSRYMGYEEGFEPMPYDSPLGMKVAREGTPFPESWNKFEQGGMVQSQSPTISEYFNKQGVSLGGSNKQSIGNMLGKR